MKRFLTTILAMILTVSLFTGCNKNASQESATSQGKLESNTSEKQEPIEISVAFWDVENALKGGESDKVLQKIQGDLNVKLVPMNTTWDDYKQKIQLWAASSELPDLFAIDVVGSSFYYNWIDQGVAQPLLDDLSKYPALQEYLQIPDIQALKVDGKLYTIPRMTWPDMKMSEIERGIVYRWDLA